MTKFKIIKFIWNLIKWALILLGALVFFLMLLCGITEFFMRNVYDVEQVETSTARRFDIEKYDSAEVVVKNDGLKIIHFKNVESLKFNGFKQVSNFSQMQKETFNFVIEKSGGKFPFTLDEMQDGNFYIRWGIFSIRESELDEFNLVIYHQKSLYVIEQKSSRKIF